MSKTKEFKYYKLGNFYIEDAKLFEKKTSGEDKGAFGEVFVGYDGREGKNCEKVAIKRIRLEGDNKTKKYYNDKMLCTLLDREIKSLKALDRLVDVFRAKQFVEEKKSDEEFLYMIMKYFEGPNLAHVIDTRKKEKNFPFPEAEVLKILKQIALTFIQIENNNIKDEENKTVVIMHRDIKAANFIYFNDIINMVDFGFSKFVALEDQESPIHMSNCGTPPYMDPERLKGDKYSVKSDIWSTGIMIYELIYGYHPWKTPYYNDIKQYKIDLEKEIKRKPLEFPEKPLTNDDTKDLISKMLGKKDKDRISWKDLYEHKALKNIKVPNEKD